ncbi:MAG TPA: peptide chain release factor 2 [Solirubrobacterales bacterium]|nr:peptide chain release factor 2 [Solirubrobacterales bacterium]
MADTAQSEPVAPRLAAVREQLSLLADYLDPAGLEKEAAALEEEMGRPGFWDDQEAAAKTSAAHARAQKRLEMFRGLESDVADLTDLAEMAAEDEEMAAELEAQLGSVEGRLAELEEARLFSGEYDAGDAVVTVHAGAGGTDSQDWAEILLRMYLRWAERRGFAVEMVEASAGEEAGLKSATFIARGENAYGLFAAERGVHRLVRISPFDSSARRHTSFAQVEVGPVVEEGVEVEIDEGDLRIDTYRASGAGGQHVNKTDSAVRITHLPTGVVVQCQNERSQMQNRAVAMQLLRSRLIELEERKRSEELAKQRGEVKDVAWGSQIRSYVMHPYTMVKDHRTEHEVGDVQRVLDGDLDEFVRDYLNKTAAASAS